MVFGWGRKKQREDPIEPVLEQKIVTLDEIPQITSSLNEVRLSQLISDARVMRDSVSPLVDDLIRMGRVLEEDDLQMDDVDKHLSVIVERGKKQVITTIRKDVRPLPEISSLDDAVRLDRTLGIILKKVGDVLGRQTRVIHIFAKKYAGRLKDDLAEMKSTHERLRLILDNHNSSVSLSDDITGILSQIKNLGEARTGLILRIEETRKFMTDSEDEMSQLNDSIRRTRSSDEYKRYLDTGRALDAFKARESKTRSSMDAQFAKISRPLGRYEYGSSLDKEQKEILRSLLKSPADVMLPENKVHVETILGNVKRAVSSGSISVKDRAKTLHVIEETEGLVDAFIGSVRGLGEEHERLERDLDRQLPSELGPMEDRLAKKTGLHRDASLRLKSLEGEVSDMDSRVPQLITAVEEKLREFSSTIYRVSKN